MKNAAFYDVEVEIEFVPFPSEEARIEAYHRYAEIFIKAKERMLKEYWLNREKSSKKASDFEGAL